MSETAEAFPEAAAMLAAAGWKPHDGWNVYTRDTLVMGFQPDGQAFHVKNWAAIAEGHPQWTADTPDTAGEAAAWLVERFKPAPNDLTTEATLDPVALQSEEVENPGDESNGETGEEDHAESLEVSGTGRPESDAPEWNDNDAASRSDDDGSGDALPSIEPAGSDFLDADFTEPEDLGSELLDVESELLAPELPAPDPEDFAPDEFGPEEDASGAFIFGDNLHQMRTAAIGLVVQYCFMHKPMWSEDDDGFLKEERNYAMGVSEGRWPADPERAAFLQRLEGTLAKSRAWETVRDNKVSALLNASREDLEALDVEAGWP